MTHRIHAAMETMQAARAHSAQHGVVAQANGMKLRDRGNTVLPFCDFRRSKIGSGDFLGYMPNKSTEA